MPLLLTISILAFTIANILAIQGFTIKIVINRPEPIQVVSNRPLSFGDSLTWEVGANYLTNRKITYS